MDNRHFSTQSFYFCFLAAVFELAIIRMSRFYDVSQQAVLFLDGGMQPMEVFMTTGDTTEMELVSQIFDYAKSLAEMQLSEASGAHSFPRDFVNLILFSFKPISNFRFAWRCIPPTYFCRRIGRACETQKRLPSWGRPCCRRCRGSSR